MQTRRRRILWATGLSALLLLLVFLFISPVGWDYDNHIALSPRFGIRERHHRQLWLFSWMADNGRSLFIPISGFEDAVTDRTLTFDGQPVGTYTEYARFHLSPDQRYVIIEDGLQGEPLQICDSLNGKMTMINEPPGVPKDHDNVYPFKFTKWSDDSSTFLVKVTGTEIRKRSLMPYTQVWQVDARTGQVTKQNHR